MPEYATASISYGLEPQTRTDMFGETWDDAVVRFGKKHYGKWLSETNRHWLSWLYAVKKDAWPDNLLELVQEWGMVKSEGKEDSFDDLVQEQIVKLRERTR